MNLEISLNLALAITQRTVEDVSDCTGITTREIRSLGRRTYVSSYLLKSVANELGYKVSEFVSLGE